MNAVFDEAKVAAKKAAREAVKAAVVERKAKTAELVKEYGLRFQHIRVTSSVESKNSRHDFYFMPKSHGGVTLAWRFYGPRLNKSRYVEVSQTICSDKDNYSPERGRFEAAKNFAAGEKILVRLGRGYSAPDFLEQMFMTQLEQ